MNAIEALRQYPLLMAVPVLLPAIAALEGWLRRRRGLAYDWKAYWASLGDVVGRGVLGRVLQGGVVVAGFYALHALRIADIAMDRWWQWLALFLGQEFCYYWMHRADHRIRWFWLNHAVHHSPNQYTLAAAYRLGWTAQVTGAGLFFAPLVWLGFPLSMVLAVLALNLLYQFWLHTELIGRLPRWIEWTFNTPTHHRVHHASNPEYLDCNYGGVLIIFDRLFGTFRAPRADVAMRYGLTEPLATYNPLRIAFHAWAKLYVDLRVARGWLERCQVLAGPPGFIPAARRIAAAQPAAVDAAVASGGAGGSTICR